MIGPRPSRENPVPSLVFLGLMSVVVIVSGVVVLATTDKTGAGVLLIALPLVGAVLLRIAWVIGTKRGL